jgi:hypothetical protein
MWLLVRTHAPRPPAQPFGFVLGARSVVDGFDAAVVGMRVGGVREAIVPPLLAYGDQGAPPKVPPHATLLFRITLIGTRTAEDLLTGPRSESKARGVLRPPGLP